jgi:hypothetical protein
MLRRSTEVPLTLATPLTFLPRAAGPWQSQDAGILTGTTPKGWALVVGVVVITTVIVIAIVLMIVIVIAIVLMILIVIPYRV